jgi:hypothetical protein
MTLGLLVNIMSRDLAFNVRGRSFTYIMNRRDPRGGSRGTKLYCVRFEVFTVVTMTNGVFWDVTPCGSCKNSHTA